MNNVSNVVTVITFFMNHIDTDSNEFIQSLGCLNTLVRKVGLQKPSKLNLKKLLLGIQKSSPQTKSISNQSNAYSISKY